MSYKNVSRETWRKVMLIVLTVVTMFLVGSCGSGVDCDVKVMESGVCNSYYIESVEWGGHEYLIIWSGVFNGVSGMVHDPECWCTESCGEGFSWGEEYGWFFLEDSV